MRIAHVSDFYLPRLGGIELQVHDLAQRQAAAGHDVEVVTGTWDPAPSSNGSDEVRVRRLRGIPGLPVYFDPVSLWAACRAVRRGGYDVVHVHAGVCTPMAFGVVAAAARAGIPVVVTQHSLVAWFAPVLRALAWLTGWTRWPVVWTAVSDVAARPLRGLLGPWTDVRVLPNGIDPAVWRVAPGPRDPDDVVVASVMRLAPRKRPMHLLRVIRKVRSQLPESIRLHVTIVGEGGERRSLQRYLRRHSMTGWVSLPGRLERAQIRDLYRRVDVFVAPATLESFGIAALEARSAGVPVVARSQGGVGDFVRAGEGVLVDDDAEMVRALVRLAGEPVARNAMAARCRAVPPVHTWAVALAQTEEAYRAARERSGAVEPAQRLGVAS